MGRLITVVAYLPKPRYQLAAVAAYLAKPRFVDSAQSLVRSF